MSTYKELVYLVLDELKLISDDSTFTEDHILFLLGKYRSFLLKLRYADIRKLIPDSNYQSIAISLTLILTPEVTPSETTYLKSTTQVPVIMQIGSPKVTPEDYYKGEITLISRERMRYIGYNRFLPNIIYCSIGPDLYLYFKCNNPLNLNLESVKITAIFEDALYASTLEYSTSSIYDVMDKPFPIEESLVSPLVGLVVKELAGPSWKPEDDTNDANDNLANLASFIARNTKSNVQKLMEE